MRRTILLLALFFSVARTAGAEETPGRTITVSGNADVRVTPDEVEVVLGIETRDKSLLSAKKANDEKLRKVEDAIARIRIDPKHVQTDFISIEPEYPDDRADPTLYRVNHSLAVILKEPSKFAALVTETLQAGANHVHRVDFRTTELRKHRDHARALAIQAAREKAVGLAKELGQKIGRPRTINEGTSGWFRPLWGGRFGGMAQNVVQNAPAAGNETSAGLSLGQITVNAEVTVTFELE